MLDELLVLCLKLIICIMVCMCWNCYSWKVVFRFIRFLYSVYLCQQWLVFWQMCLNIGCSVLLVMCGWVQLWVLQIVGIVWLKWVRYFRNFLYRFGVFSMVCSCVCFVGLCLNICSICVFLLFSRNLMQWYCSDWKFEDGFSMLWKFMYLDGVSVFSIDYCLVSWCSICLLCVSILWYCQILLCCRKLIVVCSLWFSSFSYSFEVWCWMMKSILLWCGGLDSGCCVLSSWFSCR